MGQRINVQYSIDMDDLHKEVDRLLAGVSDSIKCLECGTPVGSDVMSLKTIENVDLLRQELAKIDHTLRDVSAIISGYVAYYAGLAAQKTMAPTPPQNQGVRDEVSAQEQD